jgi:alpha-beta hydrolase superfamily lysophospholipase
MRFIYCFLFFILSINQLAIKPNKEYISIPTDFSAKFTEESFVTRDGFNIKSWHILPKEEINEEITIIISYGDLGNMSYWLNHATALSLAGYDVWLYDYRGFGKSSEFSIDPNILYYNEFKIDLEAVVKGVATKSNNKICLLGFSMGSIISMLYLNEDNQDIDYYIGDGHICFPELIVDRLKKVPDLPIEQINFQNFYQKDHTPFLIFKASNDPVCTNSDIDSLKKIKKEIQIVSFEGSHLHSFSVLGDEYIAYINAFLLKSDE